MIFRPPLLLAQSIPLIEWLAPAMMAAGLLLLVIIAVLLACRPRKSAASPAALTTTESTDSRQLLELHHALQDEHQRVAELIGVAQRLAARADDKAALLHQLITQADERLTALQANLATGSVPPKREVEIVVPRHEPALRNDD
jgi:hypothetical protein